MSQWAAAGVNLDFGPVRIVEIEPGVCCSGAWANITITRWVGRSTTTAVERIGRVGDEVRGQYPSGASAIHLIAEGADISGKAALFCQCVPLILKEIRSTDW